MRNEVLETLFVVAIILSAGLGYFEGAIGGERTLTSVSTTTLIQTITRTSVVGGTSSQMISGSVKDLQLVLELRPEGNGTYEIDVQELNTLGSPSNATVENRWAYPSIYLDPFDDCGAYSSSPVGFALLQGNYGLNNFTAGKTLALFNTTYASSCTTTLYPAAYYIFNSASDYARLFDTRGAQMYGQNVSSSLLLSGYWTGGQGYWGGSSAPASFQTFSGTYTVVAGDEWGAVEVAHFSVFVS